MSVLVPISLGERNDLNTFDRRQFVVGVDLIVFTPNDAFDTVADDLQKHVTRRLRLEFLAVEMVVRLVVTVALVSGGTQACGELPHIFVAKFLLSFRHVGLPFFNELTSYSKLILPFCKALPNSCHWYSSCTNWFQFSLTWVTSSSLL